METNVSTNYPAKEKRRRRKSPRPPGLLEKLIDTTFYQFLLGKVPMRQVWASPETTTDNLSQPVSDQSISSMAVDVFLFGILVLLAPLFTVYKLVHVWVRERWWVKFSLGILTGLASIGIFVGAIYLIWG